MLLLLTAMMLAPAHSEDTAVNQYAHCAFVAGARAQATDTPEADKKLWRERATKYLDKVVALAFPGEVPTHDRLDAIIDKAADTFEDKMRDMDGDQIETMFRELILTCEM